MIEAPIVFRDISEIRAHAILSASGSKMWLNCPPSARLNEFEVDVETSYSAEGTSAHDIAARWINDRLQRELVDAWSEDEHKVIEELQPFLDLCWDRITAAYARCKDPVIYVETKLDYSRFVPEGFGTLDLGIITDGTAEIVDLKFGKGEVVESYENSQLKLYALGMCEVLGHLYDLTEVTYYISQPRLFEDAIPQTISVVELYTWAEEVVAPTAQVAWAGGGEFNPSRGTCRWCKVAPRCRANAEYHMALARHEAKSPDLLTDEEVSDVLAKADSIKLWAGKVEKYAQLRAEQGHKIPGWKLVEGRSNRYLTDPEAVAKILISNGVDKAALYERSLLGLTALEGVVGKKTFGELAKDYIGKPKGKPTLVPESDKREVYVFEAISAKDEFKIEG
jgi:hypothetical protein